MTSAEVLARPESAAPPVALTLRDLVGQRGWFSKQDYSEGLALAQLAPGPLGATAVAAAFVLPSFLMVLGLSFVYLRFEGLAWMQGAFYGVGAAVIAIIARSAWRLMRSTLERDSALWILSFASAAVTAWTESEIVWLFLAAGVAYPLVRLPAQRSRAALVLPWPLLVTGLHGPADASTLWRIAWYFAEAGAFVFGSGLAIVPFLHGGVVGEFQWLTERKLLDAVAVAMITPGPVVIPATYLRRAATNPSVRAFVQEVTAAATGAIAGAALVLGRRAIADIPSAVIALGTLAAVVYARRVLEPLVIVAAGCVGLVLSGGVL